MSLYHSWLRCTARVSNRLAVKQSVPRQKGMQHSGDSNSHFSEDSIEKMGNRYQVHATKANHIQTGLF